jgi:hypothetical protein
MNSVGPERAGTASGINNAVARVAGVLAVAVLGVVLMAVFAHSLASSLAGLKLSDHIVHELQSNVARLGSLDAPSGTNPETAATIRSAVAEAFVSAFRWIMLLCASLALASAAVAWRKIPSQAAERTTDSGRVEVAD